MNRFLLVLLLAASFNFQNAAAQCNGNPDQCLGTQSYTVSPLPINGTYAGGQVVTFCYTIQNYNQCSSNWLHTIDLDLGPGWDASTVTSISVPASCDGMGNWDYYLSSTSQSTGQTFGPCFAYDSPSGSPFGVLDGNPGNNFGDNCTNYTWTFCFSIQVAIGCNNQSLSVDVTAVGDGTAGAWTLDVCPGLPFNICNAECSSCKMTLNDTITQPSCADNDGAISLAVDSAIGAPTFSWQPGGQTTPSISGLSSGTYIGTVTDTIGCTLSDTVDLQFVNPVQLTHTLTNAQCNGYCNGSLYLYPTNGAAPYTYTWSNGLTSSFDTALCAGTYYITITDTTACTVFDTVVITEPTQIVLTTTETDASCFGGSDGSAGVTASGGSGVYFYFWQPSNQLTANATSLPAYTYTIYVTDSKGCLADTTVVVGSPPKILTNPTITNVSCFGLSDGAIVTNVSSGVPPYTYDWINSSNTSPDTSNLAVGTYYLLVTDANGCTQTDSFQVTQPDALSGTFDIVPASCPGATDGSIVVNPAGGTAPYNYEWNGDPSLAFQSLTGLGEGVYLVEVTDANGCTLSMADTVPALDNLTVYAGNDTSIELGGNALLGASVSRSGDYLYDWSPGYHMDDSMAAETLVNPFVTTTYSVTVTEISSGCTGTDSVTVFILPTDYILFPSAFTPNGDGLNDVFEPVEGDLISVVSFRIFNRWGAMVFDDNTQGWNGYNDGKPEEIGAYVYSITYTIDGRQGVFHQKGSVTLLR